MPDRALRVGVVEKNRASYWDMVNAGWEDAGRLLGLELDIRAPETEDVPTQLALMQELIEEGVDALAFVGTEDGPFDDLCRIARDRGILVMTFDLDASRDHRTLFVGMPDPEAIGRHLGSLVARAVGAGATVLLQAGSERARGAVGKLKGLEAALGEAGVRTVASDPDGEDLDLARATARQLLSSHPAADAAVGVYGYHPTVLADAARSLASDVRIFGFDMLPETVELLRVGRVEASIWIREYQFGYLTAVATADVLRLGGDDVLELYGGTRSGAGRAIQIKPVVVTPDTLADFEAWRDARGLRSRTGPVSPSPC